jgi:hypothetical protein
VPADAPVAFSGVSELRDLISQWIGDVGHRTLVEEQVLGGLRKIASEAVAQLVARKKVLSLSISDRAELREKAKAAVETTRLNWEDVKLALRKRQIAAGDMMESGLLAQKGDLVDRLRYELRSRPEPTVWWKEDLPFRLRQEFGRLGRDAQASLERKIGDDFRWVQEQAKAIYSRSLPVMALDVSVPFEVPEDVKGKDQPDLNKVRQYTRLAVGGVTIGAFALLGPLASVVSLGGGVLSENYFRRQLNAQKQELSETVARVIDDLLRKAAQMIRARIEILYSDIEARLGAEGNEWLGIAQRTVSEPTHIQASGQQADLQESIHRWSEVVSKLTTLARN